MKNRVSHFCMILFIAFLVSLLPLLEMWHTQTVYSGSDLQFHINRIHELVMELKSGSLNLISVHSFDSVGSGVQYFYPNLTLFISVGVFLIIKNTVTAYYTSLLIYGIITFIIAEYSFRKLLITKWLSILGAIIYSLSFYRVFSVIGVSAFGEFIAISWIPLIVLGYYRIIHKQGWKTLWISMVLLGYTHLLSLIIAVFILLIITIIRFVINYKVVLNELRDYSKSAVAFLISFIGFLVPFLILTKQNHITTPDATLHYQWAQTFAGYYVSSFRLLSARTLGFVFILLLFFMFIMWKHISKRSRFIFWFALGVTFVASSDFPWFELLNTPFANIQFPYRLLPFSIMLLTLASLMGIKDYFENKNDQSFFKYMVIGLSAVSILTTAISVHQYKHQADATYSIKTTNRGHLKYTPFAQYLVNNKTFNNQFNNRFNTYGAFDYWTDLSSKHTNSIINHTVFGDEKLIPSKTLQYNNSIIYYVKNKSSSTLDLPFIRYQGIPYNVTVNGKNVSIQSSNRGTIKIPVTKGDLKVVVTPKTNDLFIIAGLFSLFSSMLIIKYKRKL